MQNEDTNPVIVFLKSAWNTMWKPTSPYYFPTIAENGLKKDGVTISALSDIDLPKWPTGGGSYQITQSNELGDWLSSASGYVGIGFTSIVISKIFSMNGGTIVITPDANDITKAKVTAPITIPSINIAGQYQLFASGMAECVVDTMGMLGGIGERRFNGQADQASLDDYLNAARAQRTRLWQTPNGGKLMDRFYDHNEVFNWLYQNLPFLQTRWKFTSNQQFMNQTYVATGSPDSAPINSTATIYEPFLKHDVNYNQNAFYQQVALSTACAMCGKTPPVGSPISADQFQAAGLAASSFSANEVANTGNSQFQVTPLTVNGVYAAIQNAPAEGSFIRREPEPLSAELQELTAAMEVEILADLQAIAQKAQTTQNASADATLIQGGFSLDLSSTSLTVNATFVMPDNGKPVITIDSIDANFTVSDITIENITWWYKGKLGKIGQSIKDSLSNATFIHDNMSDQINDQLGNQAMLSYLSTYFTALVNQQFGNFSAAAESDDGDQPV